MKLENCGKLPIGMFAEMEKLGTNLNEIDTSDCESSLESLKHMASKLYKSDVVKSLPTSPSGSSNDVVMEDIDIKEEPMENNRLETIPEEVKGEETRQGINNVVHRQHPQPTMLNGVVRPPVALNLSMPHHHHQTPPQALAANDQTSRRASFSSSGHEDPSTDSESESTGSSNPSSSGRLRCHHCPQTFLDMKSLQIHIFVDHHQDQQQQAKVVFNTGDKNQQQRPPQHHLRSPSPGSGAVNLSTLHPPPPPPAHSMTGQQQPHNSDFHHHGSSGGGSSREGSVSSEQGESGATPPPTTFSCELCGLSNIATRTAFKQHLLSHAAPRPFVCHRCDAGFATQHQLESHMRLHEDV